MSAGHRPELYGVGLSGTAGMTADGVNRFIQQEFSVLHQRLDNQFSVLHKRLDNLFRTVGEINQKVGQLEHRMGTPAPAPPLLKAPPFPCTCRTAHILGKPCNTLLSS